MRFLARLPLLLYRCGLGWMLGQRFLRLVHTGRKSGLPRETVLEVVLKEGSSYIVASGWGPKSDWYLNLLAHPRATIQVGSRVWEVEAQPLEPEECARVLERYARLHPWAYRLLGPVLRGRVPPMMRLV